MQKNEQTIIYIFINKDEKRYFNKKLSKYIKYNLRIISMKKDYRVFNKIMGAVQQRIEGNILIIDDDTFYPKNFLKIYNNVRMQTNVLYGTRGVIYDPLEKYNDYKSVVGKHAKSKNVILTGKGGILINKAAREIIGNSDAFLRIVPSNDDLWYYFLLKQKGFNFQIISLKGTKLVDWLGEGRLALRKQNLDMQLNDKSIYDIRKYFGC